MILFLSIIHTKWDTFLSALKQVGLLSLPRFFFELAPNMFCIQRLMSGLVNLLQHLLNPCSFPICIKEAHNLMSNAYDSWILVFMINSLIIVQFVKVQQKWKEQELSGLKLVQMEVMFKTGQPQKSSSSHNVVALSVIRQTCCISFTLLI